MNASPNDQGSARDLIPIRRALVSVSDKTGLLELAAALAAAGVEIVSTGTTAAKIREAGHTVTDVSSVTGFPESLNGRVKTLHPAVHAGILADLRLPSHAAQLVDLGIAPFELVVVNLYPFAETVASGAAPDDVIEQIDIGGPAMVRSAAKNFANVAVVVSAAGGYATLIDAITEHTGTTLAERRSLAAAAFTHTAAYDTAVSDWFAGSSHPAAVVRLQGDLKQVLRYGENSHQNAALYLDSPEAGGGVQNGRGIAQSEQLHGKEMSYNNYVDADAALRAAYDFDEPAVAVVKHANPCGIALAPAGAADPIAEAHKRAHACDPVSAYGGVIAANRTVTLTMAETVKGIFTEVVVAPDFEPEALELLRSKKNLRVLKLPVDFQRNSHEIKQISGGLLVQGTDSFRHFDSAGWSLVSGDEADAITRADLEFAWKACRSVKSNAILLANDLASVGVGMGQVNRVDSCNLAVARAGERAAGSVAASDAFFPFADGLQILLDAGVRAVVQPGGSIRDEEVIAVAQAAGVTMYFTGERHFYH